MKTDSSFDLVRTIVLWSGGVLFVFAILFLFIWRIDATSRAAVFENSMKIQSAVRSYAEERDLPLGDPLTVPELIESGFLEELPEEFVALNPKYRNRVPERGQSFVDFEAMGFELTPDGRELLRVVKEDVPQLPSNTSG